ncbi:cation channel sperm-associated protein 1-like [Engraulis encrasicolus]|uniref:cation channel sperm-associated protein 1-like n=1 Tax=Engraulis encrasicolus TaxID=184585 RepID=UPI002FD62C67
MDERGGHPQAHWQMMGGNSARRGRKKMAPRRVFSACGDVTQDQLQTLLQLDKDRVISELNRSDKKYLRAKGKMLSWNRNLYRILFTFTEHRLFDQFILFVVLLNTGLLVAQTYQSIAIRTGWFMAALDGAFISIYLMEFVLKFMVWGFLYFKNTWNNIDFFIILISMIDFALPFIQTGSLNDQAAAVFQFLKIFKASRAIRAFRVLRTIKFLQSLMTIISTCIQSFQSMGAIIILMFTFLLMFAVIFREMFSQTDPEHFGSMFRTIFTLFQLLTLDDWSFTYSISRDRGAPHIIIFLILYIVVEYFTFLNLFMAVLVDNFQLKIKKRMFTKFQAFQDAFEEELESVRRIDKKNDAPQTDEEFYQEALALAYPDHKNAQREVECICNYLKLLTAVEQSQQTFWSQAAVMDRFTDAFFDAGDEVEED